MADTKNMRSRIGTATVTLLACPLLLLILTINDSAGPKLADAFVTPDGRSGIQQSFRARTYSESFSPLNLHFGSKRKPSLVALPRMSFHLQATDTQQFEEQQQNKSEQDQEDPDDETSEAKRLLRDAERLRLEAEQMDASLTLQKIAVLEEKLSNDEWLKKQKGQTVKDLYEELRMLEKKVSRPNSTVRNPDDVFPTPQETDSVSPIVRPPTESSYSDNTSARFDNDKKRTNPNVPPIAGFDDKDLNLYVPVAEDVNKMAPNNTLDERIGLFRDAPELQAHFKEKIQNLLLGPLEEMQELETLKQQYLESTSSREKDALLKEIKRLEAKMDANTMGIDSDAATSDAGGISYSKKICLPADKLPPLTEQELKERYEAIKALPDILVAVYLQRNGLYNIPVPFSTINLQVGSGGINVNMNTVNNSATNTEEEENNEAELLSNGDSLDGDEQSKSEDVTPFDLYENLELAIELDYYDLQLQLLNQALGIRPMPDDVREDYTTAFRSLPSRVRQRYVVESLGIDTLEASILASDEEEDLKRVIDEILKPLDEEISLGSIMNLKNGSAKEEQEQAVVPPEYNDVEFVDRSRYLEEFYPTVAKLEDSRPSAEDVELFMSECLTGPGNKPFMVTSKPERVLGGYYIRGTNQLGYDEENSISANDRLIKEVSERLENHPTLKDKIEFYYILDPYPPTDEEMELEVGLSPLFLITGKDPKTMYGLSSPLTKTAITVSGLLSTFLFSVGSVVLNPKVEAGIQKTLDSVSAAGSTTTYIDVTWFYTLTLPLFFSFMAILFAHELGHRIVATYYKVRAFATGKFWVRLAVPEYSPSLSLSFFLFKNIVRHWTTKRYAFGHHWSCGSHYSHQISTAEQ